MVKRKLDQYSGVLTPEQIADGINAAVRNSTRLLIDSKMLMENRRYPSAAALAILAIEEAGKVSILREIALETDEGVAKAWRRYRSHTQKNVAWLLPELVAKGARRLEDLRSLFENNAEHPHLLDQVKQISFYTDCLGHANWSEPNAVVDETLARQLISIAEILVRERETTVREIELWIEHIKPVWRGPMEWMKKGLLNWSAEMKREGFAQDDSAWADFLEPSGAPPRDA
jgi:AbiV family abortive infection protein